MSKNKKNKKKAFQIDSLFSLHKLFFFFFKTFLGENFNIFTNNLVNVFSILSLSLFLPFQIDSFIFILFYFIFPSRDTLFCLFTYLFFYFFIFLFSFMCILSWSFRTPQAWEKKITFSFT
jgi:hypothetical protein